MQIIADAEVFRLATAAMFGCLQQGQNGMQAFAAAVDMRDRSGNVWALFVDPEHEGAGHGKALHSAMVGWFWEEGLREIWLTTTPGTRAEAFYRNQGWHGQTLMDGQVRLQLAIAGPLA